jgi:hypothetical protein
MGLVAGSQLTAVLAAVPAASDSIDNYVLAQLRVRNIPGVSVAVVKDGRIVKAAGYGIANLDLQAPATAQTVYELGSISKQFAAAPRRRRRPRPRRSPLEIHPGHATSVVAHHCSSRRLRHRQHRILVPS